MCLGTIVKAVGACQLNTAYHLLAPQWLMLTQGVDEVAIWVAGLLIKVASKHFS